MIQTEINLTQHQLVEMSQIAVSMGAHMMSILE